MAVYTTSPKTNSKASCGSIAVGDAAVLQGHRRGRRRIRTSCCTPPAGSLHPDALRKARRHRRPAVLPRPDAASRRARASPARCRSTRNDGELLGELAGRPAALITFLEGMWMRRPTAAHCREVGRALAELHLAGADFPLTRPNALAHRRLAQAVGRLARPRRRGGAGPCGGGRRRFRPARPRLAEGSAVRRHPRRPVSRTTSSSSATSCRA